MRPSLCTARVKKSSNRRHLYCKYGQFVSGSQSVAFVISMRPCGTSAEFLHLHLIKQNKGKGEDLLKGGSITYCSVRVVTAVLNDAFTDLVTMSVCHEMELGSYDFWTQMVKCGSK